MIKVTRECFCDLCGVSNANTFKPLVEFTTEQTEGRMVRPYITTTDVELCNDCLNKVVVLRASGAQGNNKFWLKKE